MEQNWQFFLVFTAIAIGWALGRFSLREKLNALRKAKLSYQDYRGLGFLLNEHTDAAIDAFVESLEVNDETLETHLAVGSLMRKRGEVERAIRIHQNLLARPSLSLTQLHQAHLELARDFIGAGLLGRAEKLLLDLVEEAPELREIALRHLIEIYQQEREWLKALDTARRLKPRRGLFGGGRRDRQLEVQQSHYCCELADQALQRRDYQQARLWLRRALEHDKACVRASLLLAKVEAETDNHRQAVKALRRVREQDADFLPEVIAPLRSSYLSLGNLDEYRQYLRETLQQHPSAAVLLATAEETREEKGDQAAAGFVSEALRRRPSLRGVAKLIELQLTGIDESARTNFQVLHDLIRQLLSSKPFYKCGHCGFAGRQLHWLCPSCKQWGSVKPIRGIEGD